LFGSDPLLYFMGFGHAQADQSVEHGVDARAFRMTASQQGHILLGSLFEPLGDLSPDTGAAFEKGDDLDVAGFFQPLDRAATTIAT
jgi:hypothetical protein